MDQEQKAAFKYNGIVKDIPALELVDVPVWSDGKNVRFDNDQTIRCDGYSRLADPLPAGSKPIFLQSVLTPLTSYWIWVSAESPMKIYVTDGTIHFDITPVAGVTGGEAGEWTGTLLNNLPVLNNNIDVPVWWNGDTGTPMQPLPDWPANTTAKSIRAFKYHLVAMNITTNSVNAPEMVMWSSAADPNQVPASWTPDPSNDAGDTLLATEQGGIVDGGPLKDFFVIYRAHSSALMTYVAGQYVFAFRELFVTSGIQSLNCWVEMRGKHYVFADDDVIVHDGNSFVSIVDKRIREYLLQGINPDNKKMTQVIGRTETDDIWIIVPAVGNDYQNVAVVYNHVHDVFGVRELPNTSYVETGIIPNEGPDPTWDGATTTWNPDPRWWNKANYSISNDAVLMADSNTPRLLDVDSSKDNDGEPIEAYVERSWITVGGDQGVWENNLMTSFYPRITGTVGDVVTMRVGASKSMNESIKWNPPIDFTIDNEPTKLDSICHGRYLHIRFSSVGGSRWALHRVYYEHVPMAKY
jgi:hypothetical protein